MMSDMAVDAPQSPATIQVPRPAYNRLTAIVGRLRAEKGRPVPYGEALEWLLDRNDQIEAGR
jgi:hypothetical protein